MLRSLRIKFVAIIMVLVGIVLISVLGGSLYSAWQTQRDMINQALDRGLNGELQQPIIAEGQPPDGPGRPNMFVLVVDVGSNGVILESNDSSVSIKQEVLSEILEIALSSDSDTGYEEQYNVAWKCGHLDLITTRVVIVDTYGSYFSLRTQAVRDAAITGVAMFFMLVISIILSGWVVKPVQKAWDQQRRFVADASHELKTPLAVIIANTQILSKDPTLSDDNRRWVQSTADESAHMKNLVEDLLVLARTDEEAAGNQQIMQKEDIDFSDLVESAALEFDAIAFERGCEIVSDVEPGIHITGDIEWMTRVVKILVDNAVKYSFVNEKICINLKRENKHCSLSVNNHGQTIDPEDLEHIFDRFYRTDKARSRDAKTGGFGLGLAIAKGIANAHSGDITATSDAQLGTTFTMTLPYSNG